MPATMRQNTKAREIFYAIQGRPNQLADKKSEAYRSTEHQLETRRYGDARLSL